MGLKLSNFGEREILQDYFSLCPTMYIGLYVAPTVIVDDTLVGDLVEASFDGYEQKVLSFDGLEMGNPNGKAQANFTPVEWVKAAGVLGQQIKGLFVLGGDPLDFMWGGDFDVERPMQNEGDTLSFSPYFRLRSEY